MTEVNSLNRAGPACLFINLDYRPTDAIFALRVFGFAVNWRGEAIDDVTFLHADHATVTAGHPQVSDVCSSFVQNSLVSRLDMRMRPINHGNAAIEEPPHRDFFRSGFSVHIDNAHFYVLGNR